MLSVELLEHLRKLASKIVEREGLRLYDLELALGSGRKTLRVFIAPPSGKSSVSGQGISLDDCSRVSQALSLELDMEDPLPFSYDLEVSSPGLERKLVQTWHFQEAIGELLHLNLKDFLFLPSGKKFKTLEGTLKQVLDEGILIEFSDEDVTIPWHLIEKARVKFLFGRKPLSKKGKRHG
ncbi:MAG: ribosome maturation factor RimP [Bdellovibrionaceae bacterium]|nr:ribosome maturation factor RimP [Pseudobdellovibrionaceae bacterium]MDW8190432.1 ribosome maturation factor RimP [Pseudobdellovibrionaceae bacterium]